MWSISAAEKKQLPTANVKVYYDKIMELALNLNLAEKNINYDASKKATDCPIKWTDYGRGRLVSLDETKTVADERTVNTAKTDKTVISNKRDRTGRRVDKAECVSTKSDVALSMLGGSDGQFRDIPPFGVFNDKCSVDAHTLATWAPS